MLVTSALNARTATAPENPLTIADMAKKSLVFALRIYVHPFAKLSQIFHEVALSPIPRKGGDGCSCLASGVVSEVLTQA